MKKRLLAVAFAIITIITQTSCGIASGRDAKPVTGEEFMLDTICSISIYEIKNEEGEIKAAADAEEESAKAIGSAFKLCEELEDKLSRTKEDSDIGRLNAAGGDWVEVSEDSARLIQKGVEYSELSGGDFDITIGSITELWDFHAPEGEAALPDESMLKEAASHVDFSKLETDGNRIRIADPKAAVDAGGIAKGYIGDMMTELLEDEGVTSGIINLGGNVICIGGKSDTEDFVIGVEAPFSDRREIIGKIKARDKTLVTSGVYERKMEKDGKVYHHILDTKTGWPVETDLDAVTLIADKGRSADIDALSTICLIKGKEEGMALIESLDGVEGVFILKDGSIEQTEAAGLDTEN